MSRFFAPITPTELLHKIVKGIFDTTNPPPELNEFFPLYDWDLDGGFDYADDWLEARDMLNIPTVEKDLKVNFDRENFECCTPYEWDKIVGFHTLENDLTFLGFYAGGDWQQPVFGIVYWDGDNLRSYIPTDGNPWNTKTKAAYGEYDSDDENAMERFGKPAEQTVFNQEKILKDIVKKIKPKKETDVNPKLKAIKTAVDTIKKSKKEKSVKILVSDDKVLFVSISYTKKHIRFIQEIQFGLTLSAIPFETKIDIIEQQESKYRFYGNKKNYDYVCKLVEFIAKNKPTPEQLQKWISENKWLTTK
jgi:hypothetical protein